MHIQHQAQIIIQLKPTFEVLLSLAGLALGLARVPTLGVNERVPISYGNALVNIGDCELCIADNENPAAASEVCIGIIGVELNGLVEIGQRTVQIHVI